MSVDDSSLSIKAEDTVVRNALEVIQTFALALGSQCNIEKSRLISLTEGYSFDPSYWNGEIVHKGEVFRHLGTPLGIGISAKQQFNWIWEKISRKLKRWKYILLPFPSRVKIINTFMIPLISFNSPLLKMAKIH